jgi:hypothetical protein
MKNNQVRVFGIPAKWFFTLAVIALAILVVLALGVKWAVFLGVIALLLAYIYAAHLITTGSK